MPSIPDAAISANTSYNQTRTEGNVAVAACFKGKRVYVERQYSTSVSDISECTRFCLGPLQEQPYFAMLFFERNLTGLRCRCSLKCSLSETGSNMEAVPDNLCAMPCVDGPCVGSSEQDAYFSVYPISPESSRCAQWDMAVPFNRSVQNASQAGFGINALVLCAFVLFVCKFDVRKVERNWTFKDAVSPFNVQLMVMSLSLVGVFTCLILETARLSVQSVLLLPSQFMLSATFKSSFLFYGWGRGSAVVNSIWPHVTKNFQTVVRIAPFLIYSPVIPALCLAVFINETEDNKRPNVSERIIAEMWQHWLRGLDMCATLTVFLIDLVFLCFFVHYIRKSTRVTDTEPVSQRFLLISYYGVAANLVCMVTFVMYLWRVVTMDGVVQSPVYAYMLDAIQHLLFTVAFVLLIALKLSLYREHQADLKTRMNPNPDPRGEVCGASVLGGE
ncbi:hypothetical protein BJ741DRAFT_630685 [Chytriomyces cf. hyalinus JEL632]|nr:hypothetical protein BJ741DRAFT_630685 [Chytriomyces cf. hyalinus JEL632]